MADTRVSVEGRELSLSNLDKVLYPTTGTTKGDVIAYYSEIAPALLPHLAGRPLTLKRYPNGVDAGFFYEKRCPSHRPPWVRVAPVWSERNREEIRYCVVDDLPSLVWVANLASLELHTSLSCAEDVRRPTMVVFDLDPGEPAGIVECTGVGLAVRDLLVLAGLQSFAKTSGSKGLQLYVPINTEAVTYEDTKSFALAVARLLEHERADVVSEMRKDLRVGKVFIDWSQNDQHKTTVCVYSLRARARPTVSAPLSWDEVARVADGDASAADLDAAAVLARVERDGDLFAPVAKLRQGLPALAP